MEPKRLVAGVLAHVDSGKTTLSEAMLYRAGAIRRLGRVDHQDAFLDTYALERSRGITIFAKQAVLSLPGDAETDPTELTLLDTPGHVDFSAEMERTLQVLDYAILVVSGTDGVQSHTETLWRLLARCHLPTFVFVNKMDLAGPDAPVNRAARLAELTRRFGEGFVDFGADIPESARQEALALCDEPLMESLLGAPDGVIPRADIAAAIARRKVFPCWFGSALKLTGVDALLQGLACYTRVPARHIGFGAKIFKIGQDDAGKRLTYLKVTGGALTVKMPLTGRDASGIWSEKADGLRLYDGAKFTASTEALPGMVCAVTGLTRTFAGEGLGAEADSAPPSLEPVLSCRVELPEGTDVHAALAHLRVLEQEDPQLGVEWNETLGEIRVRLMGEVQLEILSSILQQRFGLHVTFNRGSILYRETITEAGEGIGHYEPLRHYAEVHLWLEPGARGSGLVFAADCREDKLDANFQKLVLTHLAERPLRGVLAGLPLTYVNITLIAGRAHIKHTEGGDFRQATYRAVRQGLRSLRARGAVALLEPFYTFRLEVPPEAVGRAMTDLQRLGADFAPPETGQDAALLTGRAPVAALRDYAAEVTAYTRGRGCIACLPAGYAPCHNAEEVLADAGYDPDRDVDDPADSVFCSHGTGVIVKWDEVPAHAHVESGYGGTRDAPEDLAEGEAEADRANEARRRSAARYAGSLAEDKELLAIFERTYGPVKRRGPDGRSAFRPAAKVPAVPAPPPPDGPEYLLVDGYNVIFAWEDLAVLAKESLDSARRRLIDILCNYRGVRTGEVILVLMRIKSRGTPAAWSGTTTSVWSTPRKPRPPICILRR